MSESTPASNLARTLSRITVGNVRIKNRVFRPEHGSHFGDGAFADDFHRGVDV
jgi:hypothetical protein